MTDARTEFRKLLQEYLPDSWQKVLIEFEESNPTLFAREAVVATEPPTDDERWIMPTPEEAAERTEAFKRSAANVAWNDYLWSRGDDMTTVAHIRSDITRDEAEPIIRDLSKLVGAVTTEAPTEEKLWAIYTRDDLARAWDEGNTAKRNAGHWEIDRPRRGLKQWIVDDINPYRVSEAPTGGESR